MAGCACRRKASVNGKVRYNVSKPVRVRQSKDDEGNQLVMEEFQDEVVKKASGITRGKNWWIEMDCSVHCHN